MYRIYLNTLNSFIKKKLSYFYCCNLSLVMIRINIIEMQSGGQHLVL